MEDAATGTNARAVTLAEIEALIQNSMTDGR